MSEDGDTSLVYGSEVDEEHVLAASPAIYLLGSALDVATPWNSASIRSHSNITTLIRIPTGHMRFVPAHRQYDDMTAALPPAKWPVELVLVSNEAGREKYLDQSRIHRILAPAIRAVCHMAPAQIKFFPPKTFTSTRALPQ